MSELDEEDKFLDMAIEKGIRVLSLLASNPAGIGILAIAGGLLIKSLPAEKTTSGSGEKLRLRAEYREGENWMNKFFYPTGLTEDQFCRKYPTSAAGAPFCEVYNVETNKTRTASRFDPVFDLFPFEGLGIKKEFGETHLSDLLILSGLIAIAARK